MEASTIQKYIGRSISWLIDKAQTVVNNYVRKRDAINENGDFICISCQELKPKNQMNAGHYFPKERKQYTAVRFDLDNVNGQCIRCNKYLSGNLIPYRENLIKKIGEKRFNDLEMLSKLNGFQYNRYLLIDIIERFKSL